MSELGAFELEGRINGLRETIAIIAAHLIENGAGDIRQSLEDRLAFLNHQEDPGAVPQSSFAVEAAATREIELLLQEVLARIKS
ncbi:hypothetical protein [Mesorhizobium sp. 1B3]|uniref:hypothetical protein n=1 Tax=Mesorhizobium sp. 1B3 TaxID=3243599 RepID=UPI003D95C9DB